MSEWTTVNSKKKSKQPTKLKNKEAGDKGKRMDVIGDILAKSSSTKKYPTALKTSAELDRETEELKHEKVPVDIGHLILKGRQAKQLTQKELAIKINERPQVIQEFESGRGIFSPILIDKIENVLCIKLTGPNQGKVFVPFKSKK